MNIPIYVTYFDTAMMLIEVGSLRLLTDPVLDAAGATFDYGPVHLEKASAGASVEQLGRVDAVLLSHDQHGDNLDVGGRAFIATVPRILTTKLAAERLGFSQAIGLDPWQSAELVGSDGFRLLVTALPAQHGPAEVVDATGPVIGFLLQFEGQNGSGIYISGDTVPFTGTDEIAQRLAPVGLAILFLGRAQLEVLGAAQLTMSAESAALYAEQLQAQAIVPLHFEGWRHFSQSRDEAVEAFEKSLVRSRVRWMPVGSRQLVS